MKSRRVRARLRRPTHRLRPSLDARLRRAMPPLAEQSLRQAPLRSLEMLPARRETLRPTRGMLLRSSPMLPRSMEMLSPRREILSRSMEMLSRSRPEEHWSSPMLSRSMEMLSRSRPEEHWSMEMLLRSSQMFRPLRKNTLRPRPFQRRSRLLTLQVRVSRTNARGRLLSEEASVWRSGGSGSFLLPPMFSVRAELACLVVTGRAESILWPVAA